MPQALTVGFLVNDLLSGYQTSLLVGLQRAAAQYDVRLVVFAGGYLSSPTEALLFDGSFLFDLARKPALDGVIIEAGILATQAGRAAVTQLCGRLNVPHVSIGNLPGVVSVDVAEGVGVCEMVEHLILEHGRRRFAFIGGPEGNPSSALREAAFRQTLAKHAIPLDEQCVVPGDFLDPSGFDAVRTLDARRKLQTIDAVFAANDHMALGAASALRERGITIPERISVVGFDDDELALAATPPLTTVRQPIEALGARALEVLVQAIDGLQVPQQTSVPVELVVRRSCGCTPVQNSLTPPVSNTGVAPEPPPLASPNGGTYGHYELHRHIHLAHALSLLGSALSSARDSANVERMLRASLPHLGVSACCVFLFTTDDAIRTDSKRRSIPPVRLAAGHYEPTRPGRFQRILDIWRQMPSGYPPPSRPSSNRAQAPSPSEWLGQMPFNEQPLDLVLHPLMYADHALGFAVFGLPENLKDAWLLEGLAGHLSGTLANIRKSERLREARAHAESASAAKGEFVAMVSHELRTPLTAVLGHLDLARSEAPTANLRQRLELAHGSAKSLLRIINDLLDFSKLEADRVEVESVAFHIEEVFQQLQTTCSLAVAKKGLEFVFDIDPDVPPILVGDPLRLGQMLINLISNSTKFSSVGRIVVGLELLDRQPDDSVALRFSVTDTGIGMSDAQVRNLFQPFTQGDSSTTRRYGGTGLGLAISQRLAHLLGCELVVTSAPGSGSCFEFSPTLLAPRELATPPADLPRSRWVLVMEPDQEQARAISRILASQGHRVYWAADMTTARYIAEHTESRFDACLLALPTSSVLQVETSAWFPDVATRPRIVWLHPMSDIAANAELDGYDTLGKPVLPSHLTNLFFQARNASTMPPQAALLGQRLLLVQDNPTSRDVMSAMLSSFGAHVTLAETGIQAVSEAKRSHHDLVLMDINLPDIDGYEATRQIRALQFDMPLPILGVTADARPNTRARCLAAGMDECVVTPISGAELCAAIARVLSRARSESMVPSAPFNPTWARHSVDNFNPERGLRQVGGNQTTFRDILTRFVHQYGSVPRYSESFAGSDPLDELRLIHGLVSAAGNIGATQLARKAQTLEVNLRQNVEVSIDQWYDLEASWEEAILAISNYLRDNPLSNGAPAPIEEGSPDATRLLGALETALSQHDTVAIDLLADACRALRTNVSLQSIARFEEAVRCYDFEGSLSQLRALRSELAR